MQTPSFDQVFEQHADFVWRALARHGVREGDLPDMCQEVFVIVHRKLDAFEGRSSLPTWLYTICRRVASNNRRRAVNRNEIATAEPSDASPVPLEARAGDDPFEHAAQQQSLQLLHEVLERLSPEQREVFMLYELEGLTMREVADAVECAQGTAYSRFYAAREAIAGELSRRRAKQRVA